MTKSVREINIGSKNLIESLLNLSATRTVCLLDSCGVSHLESHLLLAGVDPIETFEISEESPAESLRVFERRISRNDRAAFFTISYDFGRKMLLEKNAASSAAQNEPDIFLAVFDCLVIHDYRTGKTAISGNEAKFDQIEEKLQNAGGFFEEKEIKRSKLRSATSRENYLSLIKNVKEFIRRGDTYQTNLTRRITARLPENLTAQQIFFRLRKNHPAAFSSFIKRTDDCVVSISPERFFKLRGRRLTTSPIKGTRPRGATPAEDARNRDELLASSKDRAENVMIVDLLRNDLGRICEFGSVTVEKLCELETHPSFFQLVSTINGNLRAGTSFAEILEALFPCGSITGAPKISTMRVIDRLEPIRRGLSMGAIGYFISEPERFLPKEIFAAESDSGISKPFADLSVAIRTMTVRGSEAFFNVGGGILIDSDPAKEFEETLTKASALVAALNGEFEE